MADVPPTRNALHQVQQLLSQPRAASSINTRSADHLIELDRLRNSKNPLLLTEDQYARPRLIQHNYLLDFLELGQPRIAVGSVRGATIITSADTESYRRISETAMPFGGF